MASRPTLSGGEGTDFYKIRFVRKRENKKKRKKTFGYDLLKRF